MVRLPTGGGDYTRTENMEAMYALVRSWGMDEDEYIPLPEYKEVDEYWDLIDPT